MRQILLTMGTSTREDEPDAHISSGDLEVLEQCLSSERRTSGGRDAVGHIYAFDVMHIDARIC